ncbi:hypothetical protein ACWYXF_15815 [Lactiplantibacillus plantarum]|uniref:Uncharacterized protein gccH n=1 Tax=Lactiplantibacillus plantarum TaxID=1590 RepID=E9K9Y5_LACPN|nr:hypothetical protein [Lactiplantibacillus plantarum]ADV57360.1 hypothetical protein [Lactiplantibacillus plantarum]MCG0688102.1 hypothetical protein [Lactiplantibacillus plantarum]
MVTNICIIPSAVVGIQESSISGSMIIDSAISAHFTHRLKKSLQGVPNISKIFTLSEFESNWEPNPNTIYIFPDNVYHVLPASFLNKAKYVKFPNSKIFSSDLKELSHAIKIKLFQYDA